MLADKENGVSIFTPATLVLIDVEVRGLRRLGLSRVLNDPLSEADKAIALIRGGNPADANSHLLTAQKRARTYGIRCSFGALHR